jgi:transposase InsO family protein
LSGHWGRSCSAGWATASGARPDIFNTNQGSQFTSQSFTGVLASNDIAISMDGKGDSAIRKNSRRCRQNEHVFPHLNHSRVHCCERSAIEDEGLKMNREAPVVPQFEF